MTRRLGSGHDKCLASLIGMNSGLIRAQLDPGQQS